MCFKLICKSRYVKVFCLFGFAALFNACNLNFNEKSPEDKSRSFSGSSCLTDSAPSFKIFFQGDAKRDQIEGAWDCLAGIVSKFQTFVEGKNGTEYTADELIKFLNDNFLDKDNQKISGQFQKQLMKFKQILVGGKLTTLTRRELNQLMTGFTKLKEFSLRLNPYMKVLNRSWQFDQKVDLSGESRIFEAANKEFRQVAVDFSKILSSDHEPYLLKDFGIFLKEISNFYTEKWDIVDHFQKLLPVLENLKKAITGGAKDSIDAKEWNSILLLGSRGYIQYLRYFYFIKPSNTLDNEIGIEFVSRSLEDIFAMISDLMALKSTAVVTFYELQDLILSISKIWPELQVSETKLKELMQMKVALLGGTSLVLTQKEFQLASSKVPKIRRFLEKFLPYISIYKLDWDCSDLEFAQAENILSDARRALTESLVDLGNLMEGDLDLSYLSGLGLERQISVLVEIKKLLFADPSSSVLYKKQWTIYLKNLAAGAGVYYTYHYLYADDKKADHQIDILKDLIGQSKLLLFGLLDSNPKKSLSIESLKAFVLGLQKSNLIDRDIKEVSVDAALRVLLNRFLQSPEDRLNGHVSEKLDHEGVEYLFHEAQIWIQIEEYFSNVYQGNSQSFEIGVSDLIERMKFDLTTDLSEDLRQGLFEMALILQNKYVMNIDKLNRLQILYVPVNKMGRQSLSFANRDRLISRNLIRGLSTDLTRIRKFAGFNLEEGQAAFAEVFPLLVDLKILKLKATKFFSNRFLEANLFGPRSAGDDLASFQEVADLSSLLFSGVANNKLLKNKVVDRCFLREDPAQSVTFVSKKCVNEIYHRELKNTVVGIPGLVSYLNRIDINEWSGFFESVLVSAGYEAKTGDLLDLDDLSLFPHVLQYLEFVFVRFDKDRNGLLDAKEAVAAYPNFAGVLKSIAKKELESKKISESDLLPLFTYILKYGAAPSGWWSSAVFLGWKRIPDYWDLSDDRKQLANIIAYISEKSKADPSTSISIRSFAQKK